MAISSPVLPSAVNLTARLAEDVLRGMPVSTSDVLHRPFSPTSGYRTLELAGFTQREHATGHIARIGHRSFQCPNFRTFS